MASIINFQDQLQVPADVFSFAGFRRWLQTGDSPDRGRFSYLDGEVDIDMSPEDLYRHNLLKGECFHVLYALAVRQRKAGLVFSDGAMYVNEDVSLSTEPDMMYCSYRAFDENRVAAREWSEGSDRYMEITGAPDMVLEVVSNGSVRKDTVVLPDLYFRAGIREFWRIDARQESAVFEVFVRGRECFQPAPHNQLGLVSGVFDQVFQLMSEPDPVAGRRFLLDNFDI